MDQNKKQVILKEITLDTVQSTGKIADKFFQAEQEMAKWLFGTEQGQWCKKNVTDISQRISYYDKSQEPYVSILGRMTPEEYTLYILKYGENNNEDRH
jgi:hypothetical protein